MNIYLVVKNSYGLDWERQDNLDVFRTEEEAREYIKNEESKKLAPGVHGRDFWIEEFTLE